MPDGNSLVNLGDITKPANTLIKKISEAVGGYFKPHQIKRIAKAEAEASIIKAHAQIEVTDLERRAIARFVAEEARRQENIESITEQALSQLKTGATPDKVEDDWITNFFEKCRIWFSVMRGSPLHLPAPLLLFRNFELMAVGGRL